MADISLVTGSIDIGDATFSKTTPVGSGTGLYDPFLATHDSNANGQTNDGVAEGFNSDGTGILDTDASKTSSLKLSDMPIKVIDGVEYYEFRVDLNETNNVAGRIVTLNEFKIYTSTARRRSQTSTTRPTSSEQASRRSTTWMQGKTELSSCAMTTAAAAPTTIPC